MSPWVEDPSWRPGAVTHDGQRVEDVPPELRAVAEERARIIRGALVRAWEDASGEALPTDILDGRADE